MDETNSITNDKHAPANGSKPVRLAPSGATGKVTERTVQTLADADDSAVVAAGFPSHAELTI